MQCKFHLSSIIRWTKKCIFVRMIKGKVDIRIIDLVQEEVHVSVLQIITGCHIFTNEEKLGYSWQARSEESKLGYSMTCHCNHNFLLVGFFYQYIFSVLYSFGLSCVLFLFSLFSYLSVYPLFLFTSNIFPFRSMSC